jgi:hypothetical protein
MFPFWPGFSDQQRRSIFDESWRSRRLSNLSNFIPGSIEMRAEEGEVVLEEIQGEVGEMGEVGEVATAGQE